MTATVKMEVSADGRNWREVANNVNEILYRKRREREQRGAPVELLIAAGILSEFGEWLESGGVEKVTGGPLIPPFGSLPVREHEYLTGKTGVTRFENGDAVPFFWGERA